ncbi:MAG: general secretion pathway protein GspB [Pseudomonadota bacterium]|nr:general secretion pathway protein GspB [Pseudomonadota bacterium]
MSYILDALRRADAERERGAVPSLHSQQHAALPGDSDDEPARRSRLWTGTVVVLLAGVLGWFAWNRLGGEPAATPDAGPVPSPTAPVIRPLEPAAPVTPPEGAPAAALEPTPAAARRAVPTPRTAPMPTPRAATVPAPLSATVPAPRASPAAAAGDRVYSSSSELPEAIRRDLPALAFGGASYSNDPASRMVILNGQIFHEGDRIASDLVLQRIGRKSAVLAVKGYRFEIGF